MSRRTPHADAVKQQAMREAFAQDTLRLRQEATKRFQARRAAYDHKDCHHCHGTKEIHRLNSLVEKPRWEIKPCHSDLVPEDCPMCEGKGRIYRTGYDDYDHKCMRCFGSGALLPEPTEADILCADFFSQLINWDPRLRIDWSKP